MKILIVGGGVAGPAFASLMQNCADITLIDRAPKFGDIGYAVALWGNGRKMLRALGAEHHVLKEGYEMPWNVPQDENGRLLHHFTTAIFRKYGATLVVSRTALHQAILKTVGEKVKTRLGTTVKEMKEERRSVSVVFSDGKQEFFDLVVGADGIHSQIRQMMFPGEFLKYYGWSIWAFWSPKGMSIPKGAIELTDAGKIYFVYPLADRAVVMLAAPTRPEELVQEDKTRTKERLHEIFGNFKESVGHMIDRIEDPSHVFHDNLAYIEMEKWFQGRVVLMGDAQHATSPITGMGASMALEDAYVLAEELKKVSPENIEQALERYAMRRQKRIKKFRWISRFLERWLMVKTSSFSFFRDIFMRFIPPSFFTRAFEKILKEEI